MNVRKAPVDSVRMVRTVNWYEEVTVYGIYYINTWEGHGSKSTIIFPWVPSHKRLILVPKHNWQLFSKEIICL